MAQSPSPLLQALRNQGYTLADLDFLTRQVGWATTTQLDTSHSGPLLETQNGGRTWTVVTTRLRSTPAS